jgi:hypothetical protein
MARMFPKGKLKNSDDEVGGGRGQWFLPGEHIVRIEKTKRQESKKNEGVTYAITETRVVSSSVHDEGFQGTWMVDLAKYKADTNIKAFCKAVVTTLIMGTEDGVLDIEAFTQVEDDEQASDFKAAIKSLGTSKITTDLVEAFSQTDAFEHLPMEVFGDAAPVGIHLYLNTSQITTDSGSPFTVHEWGPPTEEKIAQVQQVEASRRANAA